MTWEFIRTKLLEVGDVVRPTNHRGPLAKVTSINRSNRTFTFKIVCKEDRSLRRFPIMPKMDRTQPLDGLGGGKVHERKRSPKKTVQHVGHDKFHSL